MGKLPMEIRREIKGGPFYEVKKNLCMRVAQYARKGKSFYIGITSDYEQRAKQHSSLYDEMIVLCWSKSQDTVKSLERYLIDYYRDKDRCDNLVLGGGGQLSGPKYFLYILRAAHPMDVLYRDGAGQPSEILGRLRNRASRYARKSKSFSI